MERPCTIVIERAVRDRLKDVAKKSQRYTDIVEELVQLKESKNEDVNTA